MDPEEFFTEEFTTPVTLPDGSTADGIFDNEHLAVSLGIQLDASQPQVAVLDATAAKLNDGDILKIQTKEYAVKGFEPDGAGITLIKLESIQ